MEIMLVPDVNDCSKGATTKHQMLAHLSPVVDMFGVSIKVPSLKNMFPGITIAFVDLRAKKL